MSPQSSPRAWLLPIVLLVAASSAAAAQAIRPRATLVVVTPEVTLAAGSTITVSLRVELPAGVHVQAHKPKDPLLIPTVLTIDAPAGIAVTSVSYPSPAELSQAGRVEPLLVLGPVFDIAVTLAVAADAPRGRRSVPAVLRYQACNDTVCFPPARAASAWTLTVSDAS
jgi:DsbC/DsbD-like thiol-disulfide interchange protein